MVIIRLIIAAIPAHLTTDINRKSLHILMSKPLRLLLIEDSEDDALLLQRSLQRSGFNLTAYQRVTSAEALHEAFARQTWDAVIADYSMPGFSGLAALEIFKETGLDIPFILVSGTVGEEIAVQAMKAGAHDYVMKDNLTRLAPALERELQEAEVRRARARAEERVRMLSRAVEQSPGIVIITDLDGKIEYVNPRFTEVTGYTPEEVLGQNPRILKEDIIAPDDIYRQLWETVTQGREWRGELQNRRKNGEHYWTLATISPIRDDSGKITHYMAVQEDVTEKRQAEAALRESEARFRQLFEQAADAIILHDMDGKIVNANHQAATSLGYDREQLIGMTISEIADTPDPDDLRRFWETLAASGERITINSRHHRRDGSSFPVEVRLTQLTVQGQDLFMALVRDVTEREQMQAKLRRYSEQLEDLVQERTEQLRQTMEQLQAILNNSSDAILLASTSGDILAANPAFRQLFGGRVNNALEEMLHLLATPQQIESMSLALFTVLQEGQSARFEATVEAANGEVLDVDVILTPVMNLDDSLGGLVLSLRDVTTLKEIERLKSRFVEDAAHDLASPITTLKMHLHALRKAPEHAGHHISALETQAQRLEHLVNDLRTLSQIDKGLIQFTIKPDDLNALVAAAVDAQRPRAAQHGQTLSLHTRADLPPTLLDRDKFDRVLDNLIGNAVNYTPDGGQITVTTDCDDTYAIVRITDTGIGIDREDIPRIFERFFRSESARIHTADGTGLGLSIVREIVDAHRGAIHVESAPGQGSTFTVRVPLAANSESGPNQTKTQRM